MAIIETKELTYVYGENTPFRKVALDKVSIEINEGEMIGLIGHTGSGKSTLIQHFNGLMKPTSGKVLVDGEDFFADKKKLREVRFKVGLVFQYPEYQLFEETVAKDIAYGPKNMGLDEAEINRRVHDAAELVGLTAEQLQKSPFELSGGQKRRAAIAGVMAMEPKALILDEPASGLDPQGRDRIFDMLKRYHTEKKNTVIVVSHSMEDIAKFADRILVMNEGSVFCFDTPPKVFGRSRELEQIGLAVPQVTRVIGRLNDMGFDLGSDVYTIGYAEKLIRARLGEKVQ
ncbi:energy-coupling factor transport system ATP-binding protein [Ruminococcus sp. YE71]|uniref:energy-coupling factor transporter ATPase n=1 Tax=unclassified Ruminococcus TaxID=2608920 RepID=UPI00088D5887|nr:MULTISPECIES: energy-coupling factor transporter ATPase [unclassified Ruminococcus]SDA16241.1 energy-coupling factor transport system ATP-binding protein [Ruminococcus sp. YE78]SFW24303.1 energy-coupling factor transport system ATP-binding protein [Ruminococcus sp. YE71]